MPHAHLAVPATFALPLPLLAVSFDEFLARHDLPRAATLPARAMSCAWGAYTMTPRYVGYSEPPRAMSAARAKCREMQDELCELARAIVAVEYVGQAS